MNIYPKLSQKARKRSILKIQMTARLKSEPKIAFENNKFYTKYIKS